MLAGVLFILSILAGIPAGPAPNGADAYLKYLAGQNQIISLRFGLFALSFISLIPGALSLYLVLKDVRNYMLLATGFAVVLIPFRILEGTLLFSQVGLGEAYAAATNETTRTAYIAAYDLTRFLGFPVFLIGLLSTSLWLILTSIVMARGSYSKGMTCLGIFVGSADLLTIAFELGLGQGLSLLGIVRGIVFIASAFGTPIWLLAVGYKLYKQSR